MSLDYPRVLILSRTQISEFNSQGAALGGWFRDWPKDRLAHVYSSKPEPVAPYCGRDYLLSGRERRFGGLFEWLKRTALGNREPPIPATVKSREARRSNRITQTLRRWGWESLVETGLWEVILPPVLSPRLRDWVADFRPDVMFANVTDIGYMRFAMLLHEAFGLPICLEIADDWPNTYYRGTPVSWLTRPAVASTFRKLLAESVVCLTIGKEMERDYRSRYRGVFEALMCCEEPERFLTAQPRRSAPNDEIVIAYCGGVGRDRWRPMVDLLEAVGMLRQEGMRVALSIYSSEYPPEAAEAFSRYPHARLAGTPCHADVPAILKGADVLFHGEGFEPRYREYVRLSVSSKSQLYMISGVPILVYGPPEAGVVKYAREAGWACVVDRADRALLKQALQQLCTDQTLRGKLVDAAKQVFYQNHNAVTVRERLRQVLTDAAATARNANLAGRS